MASNVDTRPTTEGPYVYAANDFKTHGIQEAIRRWLLHVPGRRPDFCVRGLDKDSEGTPKDVVLATDEGNVPPSHNMETTKLNRI